MRIIIAIMFSVFVSTNSKSEIKTITSFDLSKRSIAFVEGYVSAFIESGFNSKTSNSDINNFVKNCVNSEDVTIRKISEKAKEISSLNNEKTPALTIVAEALVFICTN